MVFGLGIVIVALKLAGSEVTWAFQFQNPWFNFVISCIVLVFALNLFGVFEIVLPGRASTALADASSQEGYAGSFFQGIFATLLATPCTAPFLGTALGFAFSQSWIVILAMFASVAFGMSAPYFFLSARPGWLKLLPKPGPWMERVKQFMGFPLWRLSSGSSTFLAIKGGLPPSGDVRVPPLSCLGLLDLRRLLWTARPNERGHLAGGHRPARAFRCPNLSPGYLRGFVDPETAKPLG